MDMNKYEQQRFKLELDDSINLKDFNLPSKGITETPTIKEILLSEVPELKYYGNNPDVMNLSSLYRSDNFVSCKTSRETGELLNPSEFSYPNYKGFFAYSRSTRLNHIDHRARIDGTANTLSTGDGCRNQSTQNFVIDPDGIRRLLPIECERLQSYPDNYTKYGRNENGVYTLTDSDRYKLCGNGVTSKVSQTLLEAFLPEGIVRVGSTFSGCGGTELRLPERFQVQFHSDNDQKSSEVLKYHHPDIPNLGDILELEASSLPDVDLLLGGFPCQSFSIAGKRAGFEDARGTLFFELARILKERKVKNFMFENVKGLLSHDKGNTFKKILEVLSELGYSIDYKLVNSKDFGVPQSRERVFIFGRLNE